ncbi:hypothetical protein [Agrobacterium tumefaciens]|uniref:hypothetical protein n=1 Tax=Agrobacterium tumefaciens TaxID=358 RepID=UPI001FAAD26C|nr:hypothetical protein [Agrobacterium tumefaciens]UNZ49320.1 hypothetical protein MLE07_07935 [Agrobacterium tumefaciens]
MSDKYETQMRGFSVDENNRLLWNGDVMVTESRLTLTKLQLTLAILATIGTLASGIHPFLVSFGVF